MGQETDTRRNTHSLQISVNNPKGTDQIDKSHSCLSLGIEEIEYSVQHRAETDDEIDGTCKQKAKCHNLLLAVTVDQHSVYETREAVYDTVDCKEYTELYF